MQPPDSDFYPNVQAIFDKAAFIANVGIKLHGIGSGWCETVLALQPQHMQQDDFVHAGVIATMADHTAGAAAGSLMKPDQIVLTAEFKINLLRPAQGDQLLCRAEVLKAGSLLTVAESEVFSQQGERSRMVAKAMVTLAIVDSPSR